MLKSTRNSKTPPQPLPPPSPPVPQPIHHATHTTNPTHIPALPPPPVSPLGPGRGKTALSREEKAARVKVYDERQAWRRKHPGKPFPPALRLPSDDVLTGDEHDPFIDRRAATLHLAPESERRRHPSVDKRTHPNSLQGKCVVCGHVWWHRTGRKGEAIYPPWTCSPECHHYAVGTRAAGRMKRVAVVAGVNRVVEHFRRMILAGLAPIWEEGVIPSHPEELDRLRKWRPTSVQWSPLSKFHPAFPWPDEWEAAEEWERKMVEEGVGKMAKAREKGGGQGRGQGKGKPRGKPKPTSKPKPKPKPKPTSTSKSRKDKP